MDELKLRIEYLEHISRGTSPQSSLLDQVDAISSALDTMLGVRKQEVQRMATEMNKRTDGTELRENDSKKVAASEATPEEIKRSIVASRFNDLSRLATELEAQLPLEIPDIKPPPSPHDLLEKATELGREFDELTLRSTELTKRLMEQLADENTEVGSVREL